MNKNFQLEQLGMMLMEPGLKSGLYLIDTDLTDEEIEWYIKESGCCSYMKESLFSSRTYSISGKNCAINALQTSAPPSALGCCP